MVGHEGEALSKRVVHFATSLRGTRQYWFHANGMRSRLNDHVFRISIDERAKFWNARARLNDDVSRLNDDDVCAARRMRGTMYSGFP